MESGSKIVSTNLVAVIIELQKLISSMKFVRNENLRKIKRIGSRAKIGTQSEKFLHL